MIKQSYVRNRSFASLICIFTIFLTTISAQNELNGFDNNGERHGVWTKYFEGTNQPRYTGKFNHGKEIDTFKFYTLSNKKSVLSAVKVFNAENNLADVKFLTSYGKIISQGQMDGKKYIGEWVYFHKSSKTIMTTENYNDDGNLDGPRKVFYKNGKLAEEAVYKDGKLHGTSKWYTDSGGLLRTSEYKNDKLHGDSVFYDTEGRIATLGEYKADKRVGRWTYYKEGKVVKVEDLGDGD
ncbi:toxin-antitoxin system YwqK family antitoxin [Winogradskyella maritima]|uniref:Toxin-antitoxin system YwqK family antitoxin n=1 Tax=Winogradskyella maritima TaxID=1517766 RepID=A0ABV8AHK1_9FLAO|nr:toxin-antitoxin system YwqK family antitoxin [Winogradskyella maritima]